MTLIVMAIIALTVIQLIVCHFSLWWLIALICRLLFCLRIVGATFKVKNLAIGEAVALACKFVWAVLLSHDSAFPWLSILLFALFSIIVVVVEFIDSVFYVYTVVDEDDFLE